MSAPIPPGHQDGQLVVVVADADAARRESVRDRLESAAVYDRRGQGAAGPVRYAVRTAGDCDEALQLIGPDVAALVCDLETARGDGVEILGRLRPSRPDLAILCYTSRPRAEAVAALMAGADHYVEYGDGGGIVSALDLALDRRWLVQIIERSAADLDAARRRLAHLGSGAPVLLPGLRPPAAASAVLPFHEAVRRYLTACAMLFEGDPKGLADRLGVSYFALRRLLKRYDVPFPGRSKGGRKASGRRRAR